jgi:xanthine dehydrogenase accessory factor
MREQLAQDIIAARDNRQPVALLTWLANGEQRLLSAGEAAADIPELAMTLADAFRLDRSSTVDTPQGEVFIRVYNPRARLVIIGAVHTSQFLLPVARMLDYDVTIVDPREAFASPERFPDAQVFADWPDDVLPGLGLDTRTAVVALTHDAKIDDNALALALASSAFYIGALGSSRTHAKRLERLKARPGTNFDEAMLARIRGPVGLSIGAQGPAEIALSIMAQITAALRGKL